MKKVMPQEIEVWYLIPSLRKELTLALVKKGMKQRHVSHALGITESAVSQYIKSKRAQELKFSRKELKEIESAAEYIREDPDTAMKHIINLTTKFRGSKSICDIHKKQDPSVSKKCDLCMA